MARFRFDQRRPVDFGKRRRPLDRARRSFAADRRRPFRRRLKTYLGPRAVASSRPASVSITRSTAMRFMLLRKADKKTEAGMMPSTELLAAMGQYMGEMVKAGILLSGEGLQDSRKGARVKFKRGRPEVINGPFGDPSNLVA